MLFGGVRNFRRWCKKYFAAEGNERKCCIRLFEKSFVLRLCKKAGGLHLAADASK
jgi:hypothetical protein